MIDAHTKLFGIFGNPVRHSLSPLMHNRAFEISGINAAYLAFEPADIKDAVAAMKQLGNRNRAVRVGADSPLLLPAEPTNDVGAVLGIATELLYFSASFIP